MITSNTILGKLFAILFGLAFVTASVPMIKLGYEELKKAQDSPNWSTTTGVIVSSGIEEGSSEGPTYSANIQYQYSIGGKSYLSNQVSFGQYGSSDPEHARSIVRRYEKGQKISVYFHPYYTDQSVLEPGVSSSSYMTLAGGIIFFTVGTTVPIFVVFIAPKLQQRRTQALQQVAANLAMIFQEEDANLSKEDFCQFPLFRHNYPYRGIRNILRKYREDGETILFDYSFTTGSGKGSSNYAQTVAVFRVPNRNLPKFTLRPENVFDKVGEFFGSRDIDFESHPDFSKFYCLQGQPESTIREIFNFDTLQFFGQNHGWYLQAGGEWLVIYKLNQTIKPEDMRNFLEQTTEISQLFTG